MIPVKQIQQALPNIDLGGNEQMNAAIVRWSEMYAQSDKYVGIPSALAADIARMVTLEMQVAVTGSARADYLAEQLRPLVERMPSAIEQVVAFGGVAFKPYPVGRGSLGVDVYPAGYFFPVAFDSSGMMTAVVFVDTKTVGSKHYTRLEYHKFDAAENTYEITNSAYVSDSRNYLGRKVSLTALHEWAELATDVTLQNITAPLFAYLRMPTANNIAPSSPLGVSVYSRAENLIGEVAKQWGALMWEFESGERAVYTDINAFEKTKDGKAILPNRRLYRLLDLQPTLDSKGFFHDWSPNIREQNYINGIDATLKRIEYAVGIAYGTISDPANVDKTATEIKQSKQRSYAMVSSIQKSLAAALDALLYAMGVYATLYKIAPAGEVSATYDFDDSVVTDKAAVQTSDRLDVNMGVMSKTRYLMRNYGMDEETALRELETVRAEQGSVGTFFRGEE